MRILAFSLGGFVLAADLFTKWLVKNTVWLHYYPVVKGLFTIQYVRNEGIAFGILHNLRSDWKPILLSVVALVAIFIVVYYILRTPIRERAMFVSLGLLLGGITGNLIDRLMHHYVVDFLTLHWQDKFAWPTFNVADAAISTGVFLILLLSIFSSNPEEPERPTSASKGSSLSLLLILFGAGGFTTQETAEIIQKLQAHYDQIQSFTADFEQKFSDRGISLQEKGKVMMKRPGRMYWEYQDPLQKYFVADGEKTYFYVPQDKQVIVSRMNLAELDSPLLFLLGQGDFHRDFFVSREDDPAPEPEAVTLRLTPRIPNPEFSYLVMEVDSGSFTIRRLTVVEPIGQQNEYRLSNVRLNVSIPDRQFRFEMPSGVEVLEQ